MILLIGYGNPLCGDDGIGPYAIRQLALANEDSRGDVECLTLRQLTPELAEPVSRADTVIFVDAADGGTPGSIASRELIPSAKLPRTAPGAFTHHFDPILLLESARLLYGNCPAAYQYTIAGENFKLGDSFSRAVESASPSLLDQLEGRISQCMNLVSHR